MKLLETLREEPPEPAPARLPAWWIVALAVTAATAVQMTRRPGPPQPGEALFAEDGRVFMTDALSETFPSPLLDSYVGYLHVVPRTIAEVASVLPIEWAAAAFALMTALCVSLLAVFVFVTTAAWIESPGIRLGLAVAFVLLPATSFEVAGAAANLHWYLLFAAFCALAYPARSRRAVIACSAVTLLTALSDPLSGLLLPVAAVNILRAGGARVVAGALALGLAVQGLARTGEVDPAAETKVGDLPGLIAERVATSVAIGDRWVPDAGALLSWAFLVLVAAGCVYAFLASDARARLVVVAALLSALLTFSVPLLLRGTEVMHHELLGSRYVVPPALLLLTVLAIGLDRLTAARPARRPLLAMAGLWLATVLAVNLSVPHHSAGGPRWKPGVESARAECATLPRDFPRVVDVRIPPNFGTELTWTVRLDCGELED